MVGTPYFSLPGLSSVLIRELGFHKLSGAQNKKTRSKQKKRSGIRHKVGGGLCVGRDQDGAFDTCSGFTDGTARNGHVPAEGSAQSCGIFLGGCM